MKTSGPISPNERKSHETPFGEVGSRTARVWKSLVLFGAAVLLAGFSIGLASPKDDGLKGDLAKLQGDWTATKESPVGDVRFTLKIAGDRFDAKLTIVKEDRSFSQTGTFALNEKTSPKEMDWTIEKSGAQPPGKLKAIYRLDGDALIVCTGTERPKTFEEGKNGIPTLKEYRRVPKSASK